MKGSKRITNEEETISYYRRIAKKWANERRDLYWEDELKKFSELLASPAKILEVGFGSWRDAKWFISNGYQYTGFDIVPEFINLAPEDTTGRFLLWDMNHLEFLWNEYFDWFWACACFVHTPRWNLPNILKQMKHFLNSDAVGFISIQQWKEDGWVEQLLEDGTAYRRFFVYYTEETMRSILIDAGFEILWIDHNKNDPKKWLSFFVRNK